MQKFKYKYPLLFDKKFYFGFIGGLLLYFVISQIILNPFGIRKLLSDDRSFVFSRIERHFIIPKDTTGSLFEVADASKLQNLNEALFSNVRDGDKIVIYGNIAVIYNIKEDRIVNVITLSQNNIQN